MQNHPLNVNSNIVELYDFNYIRRRMFNWKLQENIGNSRTRDWRRKFEMDSILSCEVNSYEQIDWKS